MGVVAQVEHQPGENAVLRAHQCEAGNEGVAHPWLAQQSGDGGGRQWFAPCRCAGVFGRRPVDQREEQSAGERRHGAGDEG